jgi:hypothetical protein
VSRNLAAVGSAVGLGPTAPFGTVTLGEEAPFRPVVPETLLSDLETISEQRPAAFRFTSRNDGKIDVLPEQPEALDASIALDTYRELVDKLGALRNRLVGTNSAQRASRSVARLLEALGSKFEEVRPGVLLSRMRSVEADQGAFSDELSVDAIAMYDDALRSGRDLLACFPAVRRIEAEGTALHLDRNADAIPTILRRMEEIKSAAMRSGAVTEEAIGALAQNDAALEEAIDPVAWRGLIADEALVFGNFVRAVIGGVANYGRIAFGRATPELRRLGADIWREIKIGLPKGAGEAARLAPLIGVVTLAGWLGGPVAGIASVIAQFRPLARILKSLDNNEKPGQVERGSETGPDRQEQTKAGAVRRRKRR